MWSVVSGIVGLFTGKSTRMFAWGALVLVLVAGGAFVGHMIINDLKKDNQILKLEQGRLQGEIKARDNLIEQQRLEGEAFMEKAENIVKELDILQRKMAKNSMARKTDFDSMVVRRPSDGSPVDAKVVEQKANSGMNGFFTELETMSREGIDEKK